MRIAFDAQPLLDGTKSGVGFHEDGLIKAFMKLYPKQFYFFHYFYLKNGDRKKKSIEKYGSAGNRIAKGARFPAGIYRWISTFFPLPYAFFFGTKVDITHFFNYYVPPFVRGKTIVTIHDMAFRRFPETVNPKTRYFLQFVMKRSIKRADQIITVSEFSKAEIQKFYHVPEEKIAVVPNGVEIQRFHPNYTSRQKERVKKKYGIDSEQYFLFLGNIEPRKNLVRLLKAYEIFIKRMEKEQPPLLVLAGGKGWIYDEIFAIAEQDTLKGKVHFAGYVADKDVPVMMAGAEIFCFPSLYEGFGMPVLEAMACGTPTLVSKGTVMEEITKDAGFTADPFSIDSIADGLFTLHQNQEIRKKLALLGLERAKKYSWESSGKILYQIYKTIGKSNKEG